MIHNDIGAVTLPVEGFVGFSGDWFVRGGIGVGGFLGGVLLGERG